MKAQSLFLLGGLLLVVFLVYQAYLYATDSPYRISSEEAKYRIQHEEIDVILDVRTDIERETLGFYPGSVHIPSGELKVRLPSMVPNKQTRILAYCNTGHRARKAADTLHALGYENAVYISSNHTSFE